METNSSSIIIPEDWANAADTIIDDSATSSPPIALICGAKNSGKTTFSRHLVNILLQRYKKVAYLDTDVGQTEFTPPGFLSLTVIDKITPDLMVPCLKTPDKCYFFGDISSKRDPNMYLKYIFALYDYYRKVYCVGSTDGNHRNIGVPLVVNTPGWVKGIGYDLLVDILKYICPTHVVKICISAESKNLPPGEFWLDGGYDPEVTLIEVKSARQDSLQRSVLIQKDAHHLRELRIMAYFRQCFPNDSPMNTIKELARALAAHSPYEISLSDIKIKYLHCQIPNAESFYNLNASIVGLAVSPDVAEQLPQCVGLGIVRSIDTSRRLLYIITPVLPNILEKVDLLLQGHIQIPTCLLQVKGCISPYMSANVLPID
ncbi:polynucleotide 5'-hydroxyl-kinase NOL9 [Impatiens glandulifera]|uniref:polynucleotide 5'-hydroxyl-kinase NOL9 n=1 Tax=Impatiens glandulifera TaxID=253017 RepID=UPI001FB16560|nr:polynucleotide 5'-hydroxyl-kinase NOL9 [Impatiens glandulifera]XP_047336609.1 polynucleotide 5'-hydroxyl-kinase NOL9 [Impatiens glandulifera]